MAEAPRSAIDVRSPVALQGEGNLELNLLSLASPEMWMGRWVAKDVEVDIGRIGSALPDRSLTAAVKDASGGALFSFVYSFLPGPERVPAVARSPLACADGSRAAGPHDDYVVLRLYEAVQDGASLGLRLGYQRYARTGGKISDVLLSLCARIR